MKKFANTEITWLNMIMKNQTQSIKNKIISKYFEKSQSSSIDHPKRSDINVLLNRIELNKKNESRKKIYFSAAASTCLILFGLVIF